MSEMTSGLVEREGEPEGGCSKHPGSTHELGYGYSPFGFGSYSICHECKAFFDFTPDREDPTP